MLPCSMKANCMTSLAICLLNTCHREKRNLKFLVMPCMGQIFTESHCDIGTFCVSQCLPIHYALFHSSLKLLLILHICNKVVVVVVIF